MTMIHKNVRPDSKGRISLGSLAKGVSSFHVTETADHKIILEPYAEIPAQEKWLFDSKNASASVQQGLKDMGAGKLSSRGSFSKFADDEI